jgi:hypothetical protein
MDAPRQIRDAVVSLALAREFFWQTRRNITLDSWAPSSARTGMLLAEDAQQ